MTEMADADVPRDEDFDPDDWLFHYTSSEGLLGILQSGCLWATHYKFLNDVQELRAIEDNLARFICDEVSRKIAALKVNNRLELKDGVSIREVGQDVGRRILRIMYTTTEQTFDSFIFSAFCCKKSDDKEEFESGNVLHWATYGREAGYALQLDPHKMFRCSKKKKKTYKEDGYITRKVVYVKGLEILNEWKKDYQIIGDIVRELAEAEALRGSIKGVNVGRSLEHFLKVTNFSKSAIFSHEREGRIVLLLLKNGNELKHPVFLAQRGRVTPRPYVKLFENVLFGEDCPIERIIVGPGLAQDRRKKALEIFLQAHGLKIEVTTSKLSYSPY